MGMDGHKGRAVSIGAHDMGHEHWKWARMWDMKRGSGHRAWVCTMGMWAHRTWAWDMSARWAPGGTSHLGPAPTVSVPAELRAHLQDGRPEPEYQIRLCFGEEYPGPPDQPQERLLMAHVSHLPTPVPTPSSPLLTAPHGSL